MFQEEKRNKEFRKEIKKLWCGAGRPLTSEWISRKAALPCQSQHNSDPCRRAEAAGFVCNERFVVDFLTRPLCVHRA